MAGTRPPTDGSVKSSISPKDWRLTPAEGKESEALACARSALG